MRADQSCSTDTGANASAEEAEEGVEDSSKQVNNICSSFRLQPTVFEKKDYLTHLKGESTALASKTTRFLGLIIFHRLHEGG